MNATSFMFPETPFLAVDQFASLNFFHTQACVHCFSILFRRALTAVAPAFSSLVWIPEVWISIVADLEVIDYTT